MRWGIRSAASTARRCAGPRAVPDQVEPSSAPCGGPLRGGRFRFGVASLVGHDAFASLPARAPTAKFRTGSPGLVGNRSHRGPAGSGPNALTSRACRMAAIPCDRVGSGASTGSPEVLPPVPDVHGWPRRWRRGFGTRARMGTPFDKVVGSDATRIFQSQPSRFGDSEGLPAPIAGRRSPVRSGAASNLKGL